MVFGLCWFCAGGGRLCKGAKINPAKGLEVFAGFTGGNGVGSVEGGIGT